MLKRKIIFIILLFVSVGFQLSPAQMLQTKKPRIKKEKAERIKLRIQEMTELLKLDEQQRQKITEILTQSKEEIMRLIEETGERIAQLKEQAELQIDAVLTEKQKKKYRNMTKEEDEEEEFLKVYKSNY